GFERCPAAQPVRVKLSPTIAPVVRSNGSGLWLEFSGVRAELVTTPSGGTQEVSLLTLALDAHASLGVGTAWPKLDATVEVHDELGRVLAALPGAEPAALASGAAQLGGALAPLVANAIDAIRLPSFPVTGSPTLLAVAPLGGPAGFGAWLQ
ncbi:MAG TPA: hypothetical protein VKE69_08450, partial [Planctomycetota bacterium]|nr:hypothetical protein [Planctomycetota bacterium]